MAAGIASRVESFARLGWFSSRAKRTAWSIRGWACRFGHTEEGSGGADVISDAASTLRVGGASPGADPCQVPEGTVQSPAASGVGVPEASGTRPALPELQAKVLQELELDVSCQLDDKVMQELAALPRVEQRDLVYMLFRARESGISTSSSSADPLRILAGIVQEVMDSGLPGVQAQAHIDTRQNEASDVHAVVAQQDVCPSAIERWSYPGLPPSRDYPGRD